MNVMERFVRIWVNVLLVPLTVLLSNQGRVAVCDEVETISSIRKAWEDRQQSFERFEAQWVVELSNSSEVGEFEDPNPQYPTYLLSMSGVNRRLEWKIREFGSHPHGPKGRGWRTTSFVETYEGQNGWRLLLSNDVPGRRPTGNINRPPGGGFEGLKGAFLFMFWFRPFDNNMTPVSFESWALCSQPSLSDPRENVVTIEAKLGSNRLVLLSLDKTLGFLPVAAKHGTVSDSSGSLSRVTESIVEMDLSSTTDDPRPLTWHSRVTNAMNEIVITDLCRCMLLKKSTGDPVGGFIAEFPNDAVLNDLANLGIATEAASSAPAIGTEIPSRLQGKHPVSFGYWIAIGFAVLFVAAILWNWRTSQSIKN